MDINGELNNTTGTLTVTGTIDNPILNSESSTGVSSGGVLSLRYGNDASPLFDISDGSGVISDGSNAPVIVTWSGLIDQTATYTGTLTYVSIQAPNTVVYDTTEPTNTQLRDRIFLGVLVHITSPSNPTGLNITTVNNEQLTNRHNANQVHDLMHGLGYLNISGNLLSAPSTDLSIAKSSGVVMGNGINYSNDTDNPHFLTLSAIDTNVSGTFQYVDQFNNRSALTLQLLTPTVYDDGVDVGYPTGGTVATGKWVAHRVYSFVSNALKIQFGQYVYNSSSEAKGGIQTETYVAEPSLAENGLLIGYIILRGGAGNTSLAADCEFVSAGKFGSSASTVSGSTSTLQQAYTNSGAEPEILTDATRNAVTIKAHTNATDVLEITNTSDTVVTSINGNGLLDSVSYSQGGSAGEIVLNTQGGANTYTVGTNAGAALTTETNTVLIGANAGQNLTTGGQNIGIGSNTIRDVTTSNNIAIGNSAHIYGVGDCNIAIGSGTQTGVNGVSTGTNNVSVGCSSYGRCDIRK